MKTLKLFLLFNCIAMFSIINIQAQTNVAPTKPVFLINGTCSTTLSYINDGNTSTLASLYYPGAISFYIDLGNGAANYFDLAYTTIYWASGNYASSYTIYTSPDNTNWTLASTVTGNTGTGDTHNLSAGKTYVRYVKFVAGNYANLYNLGIYDFQVFGSPSIALPASFSTINVSSTATFGATASFTGGITAGALNTPTINNSGNLNLQTGGTNRITILNPSGQVDILNNLLVSGNTTLASLTTTGAITAGSISTLGNVGIGSFSNAILAGASATSNNLTIATTSTNAIMLSNTSTLTNNPNNGQFIVFNNPLVQALGDYYITGEIGMDNNNNMIISNNFGSSSQNIIISANVSAYGNVNINGQDFKVSNGNVYARKIVVQTGAFPDFVLKKDYKLKSLPETESYIKANGHLEGVPTEAEAKEKGIDVAEMNAALLKKIEEITLLLIEQNKSIENLKKENDALKARMEEISNK